MHGVGESDLLSGRDLRRHLGWLLAGLYGLKGSDITDVVFPGVEMGKAPGILL